MSINNLSRLIASTVILSMEGHPETIGPAEVELVEVGWGLVGLAVVGLMVVGLVEVGSFPLFIIYLYLYLYFFQYSYLYKQVEGVVVVVFDHFFKIFSSPHTCLCQYNTNKYEEP